MTVLELIRKTFGKYLAAIVVVGIFAATGAAAAASGPVLSVSPTSNLKAGDTVTVSGSGFEANAPGGISECNGVATTGANAQPQVVIPDSNGSMAPVGCTNPFNALKETDGSGNLPSTPFVIHTGVIGPPATGTDTAGRSAAADAIKYPCPPTAAQIAAGVSCNISFGNSAKLNSSTNISFYSATTTPPPQNSNTGGNGGSTQQNSGGNSSTSSTSTLANTGPGNIVFGGAIIAAVTGTAFYLLRALKKVRS